MLSDLKKHHPDTNADGERETFTHQPRHDTHIIAVVAILIIGLGVFYLAIEDISTSETPVADTDTSTTTAPAETNGVAVPQEAAQLSVVEETADLPAGLVPASAEVVENYENSDNEISRQRIVTLTVSQPVSELADFYESLLAEELDFTIEETSNDQYGVKLIASKDTERLMVSITDAVDSGADVTRVLLNYVTER